LSAITGDVHAVTVQQFIRSSTFTSETGAGLLVCWSAEISARTNGRRCWVFCTFTGVLCVSHCSHVLHILVHLVAMV